MSQTVVEPIHIYHVQDSSNVGQLARSKSFSGPTNYNALLTELYHVSPRAYDAIRFNPEIKKFFGLYPSLLETLIRNPVILERFVSNPIDSFAQLKKIITISAIKNLNKSLTREQSIPVSSEKTNNVKIKTVDKYIAQQGTSTTESDSDSVDFKPHRLPAEVIAKAHVESTNNVISHNNIRFPYRSEVLKSGLVPHDQELQPGLITTARAFALNPNLLKMMSAQAVGINRTKKLSSENDLEENDNSPTTDEESALKGVHKVDEIDPNNKISQGHH